MEPSILKSTKKILQIDPAYTAFDEDIKTHINSAFSTLNQIGIGPVDGFLVEDDDQTWEDFLGTDNRLNSVRSYVYLKVRLLFDPPTTSYLLAAYEKQITELEYRLNTYREIGAWTDPDPDLEVDDG